MKLAPVAAVVLSLGVVGFAVTPRTVRADDELPPLQGKTEKLAKEAGAAVVGLGESLRDKALKGRLTRRPTLNEQLDGQCGGAGFVIDDEGYILTCTTLVEGATKVDVTFQGGHKAKAKVVSQDTRNRVALLKLDDPRAVAKMLGGKLPVLPLGKSSELKRGRIVATVGNSFESLQTDGVPAFSLGVVSAIGRVRDPDIYKGYAIETDAAVNPGNFGGPLIDLDGKVVGIVVEAISPKRWLGVAVPIDQITVELDDLKAGKPPKAPWLGLSVITASEPSLTGVQVSDVDQSGPAASAGVRKGDRLATIDGAKIAEVFDIEHELSQLA
ncbi:trypsin-like peptidase domain-containing protein, partial [bacterium]|nr:trypsin-like peptidase domain-containing protein [bacterium]